MKSATIRMLAVTCLIAAGVVPIGGYAHAYEQGVSDISLGRFAAWSTLGWDTEYFEGDLVKLVYPDHFLKDHKSLDNVWRLDFGAGPVGMDPDDIEAFMYTAGVPNSSYIWPEEQNWVYKKFAVVRVDPDYGGDIELRDGGISSASNYVGRGYTYTVSVNNMSPGTRIQTEYDMFYLKNAGRGFGYAAYQDNDESVVRGNFAEPGSPVTIDGSSLVENWVLLFEPCSDPQVPVLVSFSHRPDSIQCNSSYIKFVFGDVAGEITVFLTLPFGADTKTATGWADGSNDDFVEHCRFINRLVNNWPVAVSESFAFEPDASHPNSPPRVFVKNDFTYSYMGGNWDQSLVPETPYALIPPVLGLAAEYSDTLDVGVKLDDLAQPIGFKTKNGPLYMVDSTGSSVYELPGAPEHDVHLVGTTIVTKWNQLVNRMINKSAMRRQIHGTGTWSVSGIGAAASLAMSDDDTKEHYVDFMGRMTYDRILNEFYHCAPPDLGWEKWAWGGISPPPDGSWPSFWACLFGGGAVRRPGDIDAMSGLLLEFIYEYGLWSGDWENLDLRWDDAGGGLSISGIFEPLQLFHDWAFMAGFHDVWGGKGCHMDMFPGQLAGYDAYAKMAAALGRDEDGRRARYLAAKAQIPFVMRWAAKDYMGELYRTADNVNQIVRGFGEYEPSGPLSDGNKSYQTGVRTTDYWADWTISGERIHLLGYDILRTVLDGSGGWTPFLNELQMFYGELAEGLFADGDHSRASFPEDKMYAFFRYWNDLGMEKQDLINWVDAVCTYWKDPPDNKEEITGPSFYYDDVLVDWSGPPPYMGNPEHRYSSEGKLLKSQGQTFPLVPAIVEAYGVPVRIGAWAPAQLVSAVYDPYNGKLTAVLKRGDPAGNSPAPVLRLQADSDPAVTVTEGTQGSTVWDDVWNVKEIELLGNGPWTVEANVATLADPESWEEVEPDENLISDTGFENCGHGHPNYEMSWIPAVGGGGEPSVHIGKEGENQYAQLMMGDSASAASLWQYVYVGNANLLDVEFSYKLLSPDMRLRFSVYQYTADLGETPYITLDHVKTIHCDGDCGVWKTYHWTRPLTDDMPVAKPVFVAETRWGHAWVPGDPHDAYIDNVVATSRSVKCSVTGDVTITSWHDPSDYTWTAEFTFDTTDPMIAGVACGPASATGGCTPFSYYTDYEEDTEEVTHHVIRISGLAPAARYRYEIAGCRDPGYFTPTGGPAPIYNIDDSFNTTSCRFNVNWYTKFPSKDNTLWYRKSGNILWSSMNSPQADCNEDRWYFAYFSAESGEDYEFKVSTKIDGVTYESDVMNRTAGRCDDNPPLPLFVTSAEELKHPFIRAFPNPFNPATTLAYNVVTPADVDLVIYAADGSFVKRLVSGRKDKGVHTIVWDSTSESGDAVATGVYFVKFTIANEVLTSKVVLLK